MTHSFAARSYDFTPFSDALNFIGGEWRSPSGEGSHEVLNPRFGRAMATVGESTMDDVDAAVQAGKAA